MLDLRMCKFLTIAIIETGFSFDLQIQRDKMQ
jgi:hypothetical protein